LLPCLVLGAALSPAYAPFTCGQMVETPGDHTIRRETARGHSRRTAVFKRAMRSAIVPIATIFGLPCGELIAGTIVTEQIIDIDGIGRWGLDAVTAPQDLPVITATVMIGVIFIVVANLVVDLTYGLLDPRVRMG